MIVPADNRIRLSSAPQSLGLQNNITLPPVTWIPAISNYKDVLSWGLRGLGCPCGLGSIVNDIMTMGNDYWALLGAAALIGLGVSVMGKKSLGFGR